MSLRTSTGRIRDRRSFLGAFKIFPNLTIFKRKADSLPFKYNLIIDDDIAGLLSLFKKLFYAALACSSSS